MMIKSKKVPIGLKILLVILGVIALFGGSLFVKMKYEKSRMTPMATGEILPGVYAVNNGFVNFYLLQKNQDYLMIDAGNDAEQTKMALEQLNIPLSAVKVILLTHSDNDHISALSLFPNAQVYLPALETQMIDETTRRSPMGYNHLEREYTTLHDDEEISLIGFDIYCITTPGHTPGSMSFLLDGNKLFAGDTMSLQDGKADTFNTFYNMDSEAQRESIRKLAMHTQVEYIFTGHYGYTDNADAAFQEWR